jgi:hypothetical protein
MIWKKSGGMCMYMYLLNCCKKRDRSNRWESKYCKFFFTNKNIFSARCALFNIKEKNTKITKLDIRVCLFCSLLFTKKNNNTKRVSFGYKFFFSGVGQLRIRFFFSIKIISNGSCDFELYMQQWYKQIDKYINMGNCFRAQGLRKQFT